MSDDEIRKKWEEKPMLKPKIEKVVVNISVGKSGEPLEKAAKILKDLTGQNPCKREAKKTIRDFGIRAGEPIACIATLRKQRATEFLKKALPVIDNKLSMRCFDRYGNFSFGIKEHIEISGVKYDPEVGIFGMDVCISLRRPGYRVKTRRKEKAKIGSKHILTPEEAMVFVKDTLGVEIV
ncbi:MAG: 50S ribosomal protein L5 [Candidatus Bathyarchaeota archaeon]|nr:50S ribosomal protein L5 [Candidatus Bathyarchaeota archaeon]MDH5747485.1 50S ribosomal protein L5 [Candidatus Bathyarchaeota archaeon]